MKQLILTLIFLAAPLSALPPPPSSKPPEVNSEAPVTKVRPSTEIKKSSETEKAPAPTKVTFTVPGIVGMKEGQWRGSDHLLNLTDKIRVTADVYASKEVKLPFTAQNLEELVTNLFVKSSLKPNEPGEYGKPPLPYFHILVMVHRASTEYAVFIQLRLFEEVRLARVTLPKEVAFQAITWEDEDFLMISPNRLKAEVYQQVQQITTDFIARYNFFEKQENRMRGQ